MLMGVITVNGCYNLYGLSMSHLGLVPVEPWFYPRRFVSGVGFGVAWSAA